MPAMGKQKKSIKLGDVAQGTLTALASIAAILGYVQSSGHQAENDLRGWTDEFFHALGAGAWLPWLVVSVMIMSLIVAMLRGRIVSILVGWLASAAVFLPLGLIAAPAVALDAMGTAELYEASSTSLVLAVISAFIGWYRRRGYERAYRRRGYEQTYRRDYQTGDYDDYADDEDYV
jgi:hypothetical protein